MKHRNLFVMAAGLAITGAAMGQQKLEVGSSAPNFKVQEFIKGEAVTTLEPGNVYVVEFWATWCPPCIAAIPHLSKLQREHADDGLVIIGISTDEKLGTVRDFVQRRGEQIAYRIAWDGNQDMNRTWFRPAGLRGIPGSFVVDRDGQIQFIGNPHDPQFETVIQLVLAGRFNSKLFKEALPVLEEIEKHRKVRNWRMALQYLDELIAADEKAFATFALTKFEMMLLDMDQEEEAYRYARQMLLQFGNDPALLAMLAETIASDPRISAEKRNLEVAMQAADLAVRVGGSNDPKLLATQALVNFHSGNVQKAIDLQRRAWMIAPRNRKAGYERALRDYQGAEQRAAREASRR